MIRNIEVYTIVTVLKKHNVSNPADEVGKVLKNVYQKRYGISLENKAGYVLSDTTPLAQNISSTLDAEQVIFSL